MVKKLANPNTCLLLVTSIAALGALIWTLEYLCNHRQFRLEGHHSWKILKKKWGLDTRKNLLSRSLDALLTFPNVLYLLGFRALAASVLIVLPHIEWSREVCIGVIFVSNSLLISILLPMMRGSHGLTQIVWGGLLLGQSLPDNQFVAEAGISLPNT